ncbi:hypothetical protein PGT21_025756 [Puccinia graminis f. sp. tritici]|uniref:Uncharacterized protein n=1 Tax=Puccinia graminis f. sp. tritici TaxID=56615 RepID=A0A5B0RDE2_PUCGR|nr:hypothetical protein PGT21_025756 [Puccinia graminis f. sp. tritici]KAA1123442.1 hypothetical protein PGTUg99_010101 [Puccinia graminis f. sp. tritici]
MNAEAEHRLPSDLFGSTFCSTVQSAIERLLVEGTRHGVDLKASDKLLARNTELLSQDPSNSTLQAEQLRRRTARDESVKLIEELALGIAQDLRQKFIQFSVNSSSGSSSTSRHPHHHQHEDGPSSSSLGQPERLGNPQATNSTHHQPQAESVKDSIVVLANDIKVLHKRIGKHSHEIERIDCEHQVAIDVLQRQIGLQKEAIQEIRKTIPAPSDRPTHPRPASNDGSPEKNRAIDSTGDAESAASPEQRVEHLRAELDRMDARVNELTSSIQTILTKEIPANLHQSVELMQQDVDATVHTSLLHAHHKLAQHIQDLILRFEPRIAALERCAARIDHSLPDHLILFPTPPTAAHSSPPSNPARLLHRRSSVLSPNHKLVSENESETCNQQ